MSTATAQVLRAARDVLVRQGWCPDGWYDEHQEAADGVPASECRVCVLAAVNVALGEPPYDEASTDAFYVLAEVLGVEDGNWTKVGTWNDTPGRTIDEVYALLDRAIEYAATGGLS